MASPGVVCGIASPLQCQLFYPSPLIRSSCPCAFYSKHILPAQPGLVHIIRRSAAAATTLVRALWELAINGNGRKKKPFVADIAKVLVSLHIVIHIHSLAALARRRYIFPSPCFRTQEGGSIWERDELCVRYIIEEGKINMLLRTMNEYKTYQYASMKEGVKV